MKKSKLWTNNIDNVNKILYLIFSLNNNALKTKQKIFLLTNYSKA